MTDQEFSELCRKIHNSIIALHELQAIHRQETGKEYVISQPLKEPEKWTPV